MTCEGRHFVLVVTLGVLVVSLLFYFVSLLCVMFPLLSRVEEGNDVRSLGVIPIGQEPHPMREDVNIPGPLTRVPNVPCRF